MLTAIKNYSQISDYVFRESLGMTIDVYKSSAHDVYKYSFEHEYSLLNTGNDQMQYKYIQLL